MNPTFADFHPENQFPIPSPLFPLSTRLHLILPLFSPTEHFPVLRSSLSSQSSVPSSFPPPRLPPPALSRSLLTVTGNFASLPFCGLDKGGQCPLAGYVTGCHMRRTLWDGPALSAVTTQITSTDSHLISTSNSISGN